MEEVGILLNSFFDASIILTPKPEKDMRSVSHYPHERKCNSPQQNISKVNSAIHENDHTP